MIKICSPQLGMASSSSLGGEIYDYKTIKGFCEKDFKVLVYLPRDRSFDKSLNNLNVTYAPIKHIVPPWIFSFICLPYLFKTYKKEKFDVLRIHTPRFLGLAAIIFNFIYPKVPILTSAVTVDSEGIYFLLEKKVYDISERIIVQSNYMKNFLIEKYNQPAEKIAVTFGGELNQMKTSIVLPPLAKEIKDDDFVLLFMGVLIDRKNPIFLIPIIEKLKQEIPNAKLVIIGDGSEKEKLKSQIKSKKLEKEVILIDSAYDEEKNYWFNRMDVFVFPTKHEAFGLVITEAMSFAKVVITSDTSASREIISDKEDGFIIPSSNIDQWISTIKLLYKNNKLRAKIEKAAKNKIKDHFSWERTYTLNEKLIKEIVNETANKIN